jgi:hypothetical protein
LATDRNLPKRYVEVLFNMKPHPWEPASSEWRVPTSACSGDYPLPRAAEFADFGVQLVVNAVLDGNVWERVAGGPSDTG